LTPLPLTLFIAVAIPLATKRWVALVVAVTLAVAVSVVLSVVVAVAVRGNKFDVFQEASNIWVEICQTLIKF
jgi:hypothetical protein